MKICILKETVENEKRVALVPDVAKKLINDGFEVSIELGAGKESNFSDDDYSNVGAELGELDKIISNADVIFSDKVISLNDKVNKKKKLSQFKNFKITQKLMNKAKKNCIFLHCLPRGPEVEEKVFFGNQSKVWKQALNRVHVQKSILLYCFGKLR